MYAPAAITAFLILYISALASPSPTTLMRHEVESLPQSNLDELERRQNDGPYTAITGIKSNRTHPRLEIRELQKNADQWNLYILGLDSFMKSDESQQMSYYQIAGMSFACPCL